MVPALREEGYEFVRLAEMPAYCQYESPGEGGVASAADALLVRVSAIK